MGRVSVQDRTAGARSAWRHRAGALLGALLVHVALFVFAFSGASGDLVSAAGAAGGDLGPIVAVTLVRPSRVSPSEAAASNLLAGFKLKPIAGGLGDPIPLQDRAGRDRLAAQAHGPMAATQPSELSRSRVAVGEEAAGDAHASSPAPLSGSERAGGRQPDGSGEATGAASTGALWGAIEPCWRNLGIRGRTAVVLEVALDQTGSIRRPPRVIRRDAVPIDEPRLQAEAGALAAIAACAPRGNLALGGRTFQLVFPAAP